MNKCLEKFDFKVFTSNIISTNNSNSRKVTQRAHGSSSVPDGIVNSIIGSHLPQLIRVMCNQLCKLSDILGSRTLFAKTLS